MLRQLRWGAVRLREMTPAEIPFRAREQWRRRWDRRREPGPPRLSAELLASPPPGWPVDVLAASEAVDRDRLRADVRALLEDGFTLLGTRRTPAQRADFSLDPESGERWPADAWCFDVDYRDGRDPKVAWELCRLQHLQILATAARLDGDGEAAAACVDDLRRFVDECPPYRGLPWGSGVEVACRAASLLVVAGLLGDTVPTDLRVAVWRTLDACGVWLARYPSRFSSANNHRIAELGALTAIGALAPQLPEADRWLAEGVAGLRDEVARQIGPDGVGAEQTPTYQAWTIEWYLVALRALRLRGLELGPAVEERLAGGVDFLGAILDDGGHAPRVGDDDETVVLRQSLAPDAVVRSVAGAGACLLGRDDLVPPGWRPDLRAALLGATPSVRAASDAPMASPGTSARSRAFDGYTVLRSSRAMAVLDHGPLGFPSLAAHGHADALSLWLHLDGRPVIVDGGTGRYAGDPRWRRYFRGTSAHPTVRVEGEDQSVASGGFTWSSRATARRTSLDLGERTVEGVHDGYVGRFGLVHRRRVTLEDDTLVVVDRLEGDGVRRVEVLWPFAPDLQVTAAGSRWVVTNGDRAVAVLDPPTDLRGRVVAQTDEPGMGAISPRWGEIVAAPTLVLSGTVALPFEAVTRIRWS